MTAPKKTANKTARPSPRSGVALPVGAHPANTGGKPGRSGRPPDRLVAELRAIGLEHGVPLIRDTITGDLELPLVGVCEACQHEQPFSEEWTEVISNRIKTSIRDRLAANEQALKYGKTVELVISEKNAVAFFDALWTATVELADEDFAARVRVRAIALADSKARKSAD